ncbi:MAG: GatB/YqeY domain-containing protein, partial [Caldisericaceae bacterium]
EESIAMYKQAERNDLASKEEEELAILRAYLPEQLSEKEVEEIISKIIAEIGADGKKDFGRVMKVAVSELKGRADSNIIRQVAEKLLSR